MIGRTLSHFKIIAKLGEGGMGIVYRAEDESLRRPVALKVLAGRLVENEEHRLRFLREARAAAAVTHPHVSTIYEVGEADGVVFIAMELVEGKTLRESLGGKPLAVKQAVRLACEIAEALGAAHAAHVIHRDLEPDNIIVAKAGHAKVLDFGLAKLLQEAGAEAGEPLSRLDTISGELTRAGKVLGTASYMSPEQARGERVDSRSDLFSFGVTLYEMVTGRPPFRGRTSTDILSAILRDAVVPASQANPEVPAELDRIIGFCLEKDPGERYQRADQVIADLRRLYRTIDSALQTPPGSLVSGTVRRPSGLTRWKVTGAAILVVALLAGGLALWRTSTPKPAVKRGDVVLVADFENLTGEPKFETAIRDVFEYLIGTEFMRPADGDILNELLGLRAAAPRPAIDDDLARRVCDGTKCVGHFSGRILKRDGAYEVEARYWNGSQRTPSFERKAVAAVEADLVGAVYQVALELRKDLQVPPAELAHPGRPRTRSLAAMQMYAAWSNTVQKSEWDRIVLMKQAQVLDPAWHVPYWMLAHSYSSLGRAREARRWATELRRFSGTLEDSSRLAMEYAYFSSINDIAAALDALRALRSIDPGNYAAISNIGMIHLLVGEDPSRAEPLIRAGFEGMSTPYDLDLLCYALMVQGRANDAEGLYATFRRNGGAESDVLVAQLWEHLSERNWTAISETVTRLANETGARRVTPLRISLLADLSAGRLKSARSATAVLWRAADDNADPYSRQPAGVARAWLQMRLDGHSAPLSAGAEAPADEDLWLFRDFATFSVETSLAEPLRSILEGYEVEFEDSQAQFVREEIQYGRASLALIEGHAERARELLEPLAQSSPHLRRHHVLALVYERLGMWDRAAEEYEAVLKEPPRKWFLGNPAFWALDQYRLAKVYERANQLEKAKGWYERFLTDWKKADPGIPEIEEARKRLVALGGTLPPDS